MESMLKHYIEVVLPYRLYALGTFEMALSLVQEFPEGGELECKINGKSKIQGSSTSITNPSVEMGIIHSRVLLEFLGLKAKSGTKLSQSTSSRNSDIGIESFGLKKLTIEQALAPCTGDKEVAQHSLAKTITVANKMIAHSTDIIKIDNDSIDGYFMTVRAIPVLFNIHFYEPLGLTPPAYHVNRIRNATN